jgi:phosphoribosyl-ATP pyrophosphohydrolase
MTKLYATHRNVSDKLLDSAVELAFAFKMNDKLHIVKELLSTNFHICSSSIEDDRILDRIWKRTVDDLRQAIEEFTQAIEQCTSVMNGLRD